MPKRIQMTRQRPWRKDHPDAVIVDRSTKWGNPFTIRDAIENGLAVNQVDGREVAVAAFRDWLLGDTWAQSYRNEDRLRMLADLAELAGRDIACWCPLPAPGEQDHCHGAVLLKLANGDPS